MTQNNETLTELLQFEEQWQIEPVLTKKITSSRNTNTNRINNNMSNRLEEDLYNAFLRCDGVYSEYLNKFGLFSRIYPFTTENISGYINLFDLDNKSLLTVGSSGDQVINASLFNCNDQTVIDINPFTKYYFYLKKAAIISLTYEEFLNFFLYKDYPKFCRCNKQVFNKEAFNKLKELLKVEDYDSFYFWDELFNSYDGEISRRELFSSDEDRDIVLKGINLYMKNPIYFEKAKTSIRDVNPTFILDDIMNVTLNRNYDNIFLSNLGLYFGIDKLKELIDKLYPYVNESILLCYLYKTEEHDEYNSDWSEIYNLDKLKNTLKDYITSFDTFCGIRGILFENESYDRDSIIKCDKVKIMKKR